MITKARREAFYLGPGDISELVSVFAALCSDYCVREAEQRADLAKMLITYAQAGLKTDQMLAAVCKDLRGRGQEQVDVASADAAPGGKPAEARESTPDSGVHRNPLASSVQNRWNQAA